MLTCVYGVRYGSRLFSFSIQIPMFSSIITENALHSLIELLCTLIKVHSTVYFWTHIRSTSGLSIVFC